MAQFEAFTDYYGGPWEMTAYGLPNKQLTTSGNEVTMGHNNRAWILDYPNDQAVYWSYWHNYLGGTLSYDIDLSGVDCACSAGLYLVQANDGSCSWNEKGELVEPNCSRVELMEANINGFKTAAFPCEFDACPSGSPTTEFASRNEYGPGPEYKIDTTRKFSVTTRFFAK